MHDDATRGAHAPIEADGVPWHREHDVGHGARHIVPDQVKVALTCVVLSVRQEQPVALAIEVPPDRDRASACQLPTGRFAPLEQPSLEAAVRGIVQTSAGRQLGYVEQLVTDLALEQMPDDDSRQLSVSYLALSRADNAPLGPRGRWLDCYELLPWEDFRGGRPTVLANQILPGLEAWCRTASGDEPLLASAEPPMRRSERVAVAFGLSGRSWDDQRVVDRFDLVREAGLLPAASAAALCPGHLRLVAAGLGRLRAKIRYRPVVFELLPPEFTLFELQRAVEAVLGPTLHKQNFRRLVEGTGLVEPTGDVRNNTGGRPAKTFRFRREVLLERPAPGVHVRPGRAA